MNKSISFSKYITNKFSDNFYYNTVSRFIKSHLDDVNLKTYRIQNPVFNDIENISIIKIDVLQNDGEMINFDMIVEANISIKEIHSHYDDFDFVNLWLTLNCDFSLDDAKSPTVSKVSIYDKLFKISRKSDDSLVPYMGRDNFETYAENFLSKYYPMALRVAQPIDLEVLTKKMGLIVKFDQVSDDNSILGRIFFSKFNEYEPGTVVINPEVFFMGKIGSLSFTIIHECVHWEYHKNTIKLLQLTSENNVYSIKCTSNLTSRDDMFYWLEYQANKLTPCILLPKVTFIPKVNEVIDRLHRHYGTHNNYEIITEVIEELSEFYNVSSMAIKLRLISMGYTEARGALEYVDNHYVQTYLIPRNAKPNHVYTIPFEELLIAQYFDSRIKDILASGEYSFVDNHLCLSDSKYITQTNKLTDYAKTHIDECCVCFELSIKGGIDVNYESEIWLNRDKKATYTPSYTYVQNDKLSLNQQFKFTINDISSVLNSAPGSLAETFKLYTKWADNPTILSLSSDADVGSTTISRIKNGEICHPDKLTLFKLCIALKLPYPLSEDLFRKAGYVFTNSPDDIALKTILQTCVNEGVKTCVKRLESINK